MPRSHIDAFDHFYFDVFWGGGLSSSDFCFFSGRFLFLLRLIFGFHFISCGFLSPLSALARLQMAAWLKQEGGKLFKAAEYQGAAERLASIYSTSPM